MSGSTLHCRSSGKSVQSYTSCFSGLTVFPAPRTGLDPDCSNTTGWLAQKAKWMEAGWPDRRLIRRSYEGWTGRVWQSLQTPWVPTLPSGDDSQAPGWRGTAVGDVVIPSWPPGWR